MMRRQEGVVRLLGLGLHSVLSVGVWVGDGGPGLGRRGRVASLLQSRCLVGQGRVSLGVGLTCPPVALGHNEGGGR